MALVKQMHKALKIQLNHVKNKHHSQCWGYIGIMENKMETAILVYIGIINRVETRHVWDSRSMAEGLSDKLNPKPLNPNP